MIEIARTQDEETGDGTTSVIILAGEVMAHAQTYLEQKTHPTLIIKAYRQALEDMIQWSENKFSKTVDITDDAEIAKVVKSCLGTKMISKWMDLAVNISIQAVKTIRVEKAGVREIDIKRYWKFGGNWRKNGGIMKKSGKMARKIVENHGNWPNFRKIRKKIRKMSRQSLIL